MAMLMQRLLSTRAIVASALVQQLTPAVALSGRLVSELQSLSSFTPINSPVSFRHCHQSSIQSPVDPLKLRNFAVIGV
jgi:hypothetical protein